MKRLKFGLIICGVLLVGMAKAENYSVSVGIFENGIVSAECYFA